MFGKRAKEMKAIEADCKKILKRIEEKRGAAASAATRVIEDANKDPS